MSEIYEEPEYVEMCIKANQYLREDQDKFNTKYFVDFDKWIPTIEQTQKLIQYDLMWYITKMGLLTNFNINHTFEGAYYDIKKRHWHSWIDTFEKFWLLVYMWTNHTQKWDNEKKIWIRHD